MICDSLANLKDYISVHSLFDTVLEFINSRNIADLENGKISLSDGIYAIISEYETKDAKDVFIECHTMFVDIQVIIEGVERIGICNKNECTIIEEYDKEKDLEKLEGSIDFLTLRKGYFAIFYPQDGHAPGIKAENGKNKVKKVVFKVPV